jgi:hypothetical protein
LEDNTLNCSAHNLSSEWGPYSTCCDSVRTINFNLDRGTYLIVQFKDLFGIVMKASLDIVNSDFAIRHSSEQQWKCISDANGSIRCLFGGVC